jgi:hypothetical protein
MLRDVSFRGLTITAPPYLGTGSSCERAVAQQYGHLSLSHLKPSRRTKNTGKGSGTQAWDFDDKSLAYRMFINSFPQEKILYIPRRSHRVIAVRYPGRRGIIVKRGLGQCQILLMRKIFVEKISIRKLYKINILRPLRSAQSDSWLSLRLTRTVPTTDPGRRGMIVLRHPCWQAKKNVPTQSER